MTTYYKTTYALWMKKGKRTVMISTEPTDFYILGCSSLRDSLKSFKKIKITKKEWDEKFLPLKEQLLKDIL